MARALYRKYRSKTLEEIVGQSHVTSVLTQALKQGKIAHAYLLTGPRGIGKTSIARILAHEINQLPYSDETSHLDIIEIDAASNNGVEDVRELREKVQVTPVSAAKKIYIIDEVHMLSKAAFNALLKTLEEPPEHAVFILATTDVDKIPATIISRTQRYSLRAISPADAMKQLKHIAQREKIIIDDDALTLIAQRGQGSLRDSTSLLDQISGLASDNATITRELVERALGLAPHEQVVKLLDAYAAKDLQAIVTLLSESEDAGVQASVLTDQLIESVRERLIDHPTLIPLLDALLDVPKSSQPSIKLLTVLASHTQPLKPKSAALSAPAPVVSASVEDLRKNKPSQEKPNLQETEKKIPKKVVSASKETDEKEAVKPAAIEPRIPPTGELDWAKLIEYTREHFVAIYSVLSKCSYELDGATLTLYTGNAFYKKKLDDSKYRVNLTQCLIEIGAGELTIDTIATPPPPKDSLAASVAAIMGGGEEVHVEQDAVAS